MRYVVSIAMSVLIVIAWRAGQRGRRAEAAPGADAAAGPAAPGSSGAGNEFVLGKSDTARDARGVQASKIKATKTEAAMRLFVVEKDKGPVKGVVIVLGAPDGTSYYTEETDAEGYAEALVPVGQKYELTYLSLGRKDIAATVSVADKPNQNVKLTLRFRRLPPPPPFVLTGVNFDTGKAIIRPEGFPRLDIVVGFLARKKSARIEISGHTDSVGNPRANKALSEKRAQACRDYVIAKGIDGGRLTAVGHGDERPVAANDSDEGRQKNRRIEAIELQP